MKRIYTDIIIDQFTHHKQMAFLAGSRQVGKTTISKAIADKASTLIYLTWDDVTDQQLILQGQQAVVEKYGLQEISNKKIVVVFDEIHKYSRWKNFIKGFFDKYSDFVHIIVTGSAKLNIYKRKGDSMMGRYFLYQIHPLTVAELLRTSYDEQVIHAPQYIEPTIFEQLMQYGGFPEPFLKCSPRFSNRWRRLWWQQLFREDLRELSRIHEIPLLENLALLVQQQVGQLTTYSEFSKKLQVSEHTIKHWLTQLSSIYYCFSLQPWSKNIGRSLLKQPKYYVWDWAMLSDVGARAENFVAVHLLKAVNYWTESGLGEYGLFYLRDKEKREVDFVVTREGKPWFLVEVKSSGNQNISAALHHFQIQSGAEHAFQVVFDREFVDKDCFSYRQPVIVPAQTFLSQLV